MPLTLTWLAHCQKRVTGTERAMIMPAVAGTFIGTNIDMRPGRGQGEGEGEGEGDGVGAGGKVTWQEHLLPRRPVYDGADLVRARARASGRGRVNAGLGGLGSGLGLAVGVGG